MEKRSLVRKSALPTALTAGLLLCAVGCSHPSDKSLSQNFYQHRELFQALLQMVREEPGGLRIAPTFTCCRGPDGQPAQPRADRNDAHLAGERWATYRSTFKRLSLEAGVDKADNNQIEFYASAIGLLNRGSTKGYVYATARPSPPFPGAHFHPSRWARVARRGDSPYPSTYNHPQISNFQIPYAPSRAPPQ